MSLATWTIGMRIECGPNKNSPIWETWKMEGEPLTRYVCLCVCDKLLGSENKFNQLLFTQIGNYYIQAVRSIKIVGVSNAHFKLCFKGGYWNPPKKTKSKPWTTHPNFTQMILSNILGPPNVVERRKSWRATQMMVYEGDLPDVACIHVNFFKQTLETTDKCIYRECLENMHLLIVWLLYLVVLWLLTYFSLHPGLWSPNSHPQFHSCARAL